MDPGVFAPFQQHGSPATGSAPPGPANAPPGSLYRPHSPQYNGGASGPPGASGDRRAPLLHRGGMPNTNGALPPQVRFLFRWKVIWLYVVLIGVLRVESEVVTFHPF